MMPERLNRAGFVLLFDFLASHRLRTMSARQATNRPHIGRSTGTRDRRLKYLCRMSTAKPRPLEVLGFLLWIAVFARLDRIRRPIGRTILQRLQMAAELNPADALVIVSTQGAVRTLTLNRPAALNSFTAAMHAQLLPALNAAAADTGIRAVVITGAGRGFCAGQDLNDSGMVGASSQELDVGAVIERHYRPLATRLRTMPVPVIAAVNGVAAGAGANMALCCDFVVAARSASFIQAFSKIGLVPDCGGTWLLPRLVGRARAMGLAMLGDKLPAEEAERIGLIWRCVEDAQLMDAVHALATKLCSLPSKALAETRRVLDSATTMEFADAITQEANTQRDLGRAHDFSEGAAAFFAKRAPVFKDR
jgi:2-(1,2-epoxy-1,2-dihydrophenyl)acetyl-CoA isomerase